MERNPGNLLSDPNTPFGLMDKSRQINISAHFTEMVKNT